MKRVLAAAKSTAIALALCATACAHQHIAPPQTALACGGKDYRAFDFWLGAWRIDQHILTANGAWLDLPAQTLVSVSPDGCVLTEHWGGDVQFFWEGMERPEHIWGFSVRRYDPTQQSWAIYWMDQRHPDFDAPYVGGFEGSRGEFFRTLDSPNGQRTMRIAFTRLDASRVDWDLSMSADNRQSWTMLWRMEMRRE